MTVSNSTQLAELLLSLEHQARAAQNVAELGFSIANESYPLLGFRQALVFRATGRQAQLQTLSGLASPPEDSPYLIWLRQAWPWLAAQVAAEPVWIDPQALPTPPPPAVADGWREWWPAGAYIIPLRARSGAACGWVVFLLDQAPAAWQTQALARLAETWAYCWEALTPRRSRSLWGRWNALRWRTRIAILAIPLLLAFVPVRQTSLAPAEVISLDAQVISAPIDGVIQHIEVRPNQAVKAGDLLFSLDDTTLRNRLDVARKSVAVADAELVAASQRAFHDPDSQAQLTLLTGRAQERRAELAAIQEQLKRVRIHASETGIAVFADPDEWLGRPVSTGERIMLLANPAAPGMLIHQSATDAIALDVGAPVKLFLTVQPLQPLNGTLSETSYQATVSPEGIAGYQLRAHFDPDEAAPARIGLRGTAKLYGPSVTLGYYLLRRPLATLREWTGL